MEHFKLSTNKRIIRKRNDQKYNIGPATQRPSKRLNSNKSIKGKNKEREEDDIIQRSNALFASFKDGLQSSHGFVYIFLTMYNN